MDEDLLIKPRLKRRKDDNEVPFVSNATLAAIVKVGVPSAIAIYLVYVIATSLSAEVRYLREEFVRHSTQSTDLVRQYEQVRIQSDRQVYILQRICINSAKSDEQKEDCIAK